MAKKKTVRADGRIEKVYQGHHFYGKTNEEIMQKIIAYQTRQQVGLSFCEVIAAYENYISIPGSSVRPGTIKNYVPHLRRLQDYFSGRYIKDIRATEIKAFLSHMKQQNFSAKTIKDAKGVISCVFTYWCSEMGGTENPARLASLPSGAKPSAHRMPPNEDVISCINQNTKGVGFWAQLFRLTGLRLGEAVALQWGDIDHHHCVQIRTLGQQYTGAGSAKD